MTQDAAALVGGFEATACPEFFIKETPPAPEHSSPKVRRFTDLFYKTEHEAHVRVGDHPRIVRYYGWDNRGLLFEKHEGGDLLSRLLTQRDPPPSLTVRLQWASDVAEGMAFLHSKGVIWVDVSMANVLLSDDWQRALLCDLGGASILPMPSYKPLPAAYTDTTVSLHPMMGLPHYPHSHVWDGPGHDNFAEISPHHDRFGYGLMLFCLLTLHFPHSHFLTVHDLNEANRIASLHFDKQFDTLGDVPDYHPHRQPSGHPCGRKPTAPTWPASRPDIPQDPPRLAKEAANIQAAHRVDPRPQGCGRQRGCRRGSEDSGARRVLCTPPRTPHPVPPPF
ncbi:kinase-like domain-containing protein [Mycena galericulata]|nr:kinase-like domain-containing protein [Mycena galericulata]